ncbi:GNAT family N-acetyltransferase [Cytobacillus firmus]|uniref:GNAT family N-acetyltransferase n=1 Tax=Cytobacillus firmus TaxID=1399 RepID=UPI002228204E|nr:GNAT family protein [Cytobacillus firmus]
MIFLSELTGRDAEKLLNFEKENRLYFEQYVPSRGDAYYSVDFIIASILQMKESRSYDEYYMYLIIDKNEEIAGRINVYNINRETLTGEIGYRIGENHTGLGYASKAVELITREAKEVLGLNCLKALTMSFNDASGKVLKKNGFIEKEKMEKHLLFNGDKYDAMVFCKKLY